MDEIIKKKIEEATLQAKKTGRKDVDVKLASGGVTALNKVIKTQEQADLFMLMLRALKK